MKKFILTIILLCTTIYTIQAKQIVFRTNAITIATIDNTGIYNWSKWIPCILNIIVDTNQYTIIVQSDKPQIYTVIGDTQEHNTNTESVIACNVINQNGDEGTILIKKNIEEQNIQFYIEFNNIAWTYNIQ